MVRASASSCTPPPTTPSPSPAGGKVLSLPVERVTIESPTPTTTPRNTDPTPDDKHLMLRTQASGLSMGKDSVASLGKRTASVIISDATGGTPHSSSTVDVDPKTFAVSPVSTTVYRNTEGNIMCSSYSDIDQDSCDDRSREVTKKAWYPTSGLANPSANFGRTSFCANNRTSVVVIPGRDTGKLLVPVSALRNTNELDEQDRTMFYGLPTLRQDHTVPEAWDLMVASLGVNLQANLRQMGFVGHCFWAAMATAPLIFALCVWKVYVWSPVGSPLEVQYFDVVASTAAALAILFLIFNNLFPRVLLGHAARLAAVWALLVLVLIVVGATLKGSPSTPPVAVVTVAYLAGAVAYFAARGDEGGELCHVFRSIIAPYWACIGLLLVLLLAVLPALETASDATRFAARLSLGVVTIPAPLVCQYRLTRYYDSAPETLHTRCYFATAAVVLTVPSKLISFTLPLWLIVVAEALRALTFFSAVCAAPLAIARRAEPHAQIHPAGAVPSVPPADRAAGTCYQLAHAVICSTHADITSSLVGVVVYPILRFKLGAPLALWGTLLQFVCVVALSLLATLGASAVLQWRHRIPLSSVYWQYTKVEHCLVLAGATVLSLVVSLTPGCLRACSGMDGAL